MEFNNNKKEEHAFEFLMAEHQLAAEERWKFAELTWEVFKFYVTMLTGIGGLILALISLKINFSDLLLVICISSGMIYLIGLLVFVRMIVLDIELKKTRTRLNISRKLIGEITSLEDYLNDLKKAEVDLVGSLIRGYSISGQVKQAISSMGLKTQVVVINSFIGTVSIIAFARIIGIISIGNIILIGILGYIVLIIFHVLIAKTREENTKKANQIKS